MTPAQHHAHPIRLDSNHMTTTIVLTNEASARVLGLNPRLYGLAELSRQIDAAYAEMQKWRRLAEEDSVNWRAYERQEELAQERWVTLMRVRDGLIEEIEAA